jgi:undecaprenyl-diphosphatase
VRLAPVKLQRMTRRTATSEHLDAVTPGQGVAPLSADFVPSRTTRTVTAALALASAAFFLLIAEDVLDGGGLISYDEAVLAWFLDHRTDRLVNAAKLVSTVGSFVSLLILSLAGGLWLWRRRVHLGLAVTPLLALLLASLASTVTKALFDRDRPPMTVHATTVTLAAFPSGHATDAAAFFLAGSLTISLTVAHHRSTQLLFIGSGLLLAALVGVSRLVLAVHWLSDVVAGWALGTSIGITVVVILWYAVARPHSSTTEEARRP